MRGRSTTRLSTALVGAAASVALVAGVGFVATSDNSSPERPADSIGLVQNETEAGADSQGAGLTQGEPVEIDLKELVEKKVGGSVPEGTTLKLTGLPDGLKQEGWKIVGTPTKNGLFNVGVEVTADGKTTKNEVQILVNAADGGQTDIPGEDSTTTTAPESGTETSAPSTTTSAKASGDKTATTSGDKTETSDPETSESESTQVGETTKTSEAGETTESNESGTSTPSTSTPSTSTKGGTTTQAPSTTDQEGTKIDLNDLDASPGSLVDGMKGGDVLTGSLGKNTGGTGTGTGADTGTGTGTTCETSDLTDGLEKLLPSIVGEGNDSQMITSIISSVLGSLLPTMLDSASAGGGSACDLGQAAGSVLENAPEIQQGLQQGAAAARAGEAGAAGNGATTATGTGAAATGNGVDTAQLAQLLQLAQSIMATTGK